jgi:ankyrin repeat protein
VPFFCLLAHRLSVRDALAVLCGKLDAGASLSKRDQLLKSTPMGWACRWGRTALVHLYLSRGADASEPDAEPWATPLAWASKGGHREIIELLRSPAAI